MLLSSRGHAVLDVYCFEKREDAERFKQRFGGEKCDHRNEGGSNAETSPIVLQVSTPIFLDSSKLESV